MSRIDEALRNMMGTTPCTICGAPTIYPESRLCNNCWELNRRLPKTDSEIQALIAKIQQYRVEEEENESEGD